MPSLLEAIAEKYGCFEDDTFDQMPIAIYVPRKNPRNIIPNLLVLNDCDIDSAGQEADLRDKCHGVEELDLAQNCLSRWSEVSFPWVPLYQPHSTFFFFFLLEPSHTYFCYGTQATTW